MATATLEKLTPVPRYPTLRTATDAAGDVHWCLMHADLAHAPGRACFKPALVDDILRYQQSLGERLWRERRQGDAGLKHVVLASDCDAFNLGAQAGFQFGGRFPFAGRAEQIEQAGAACCRVITGSG